MKLLWLLLLHNLTHILITHILKSWFDPLIRLRLHKNISDTRCGRKGQLLFHRWLQVDKKGVRMDVRHKAPPVFTGLVTMVCTHPLWSALGYFPSSASHQPVSVIAASWLCPGGRTMTRLDPLLPPWIAVRDPLRHSWDTVIRGLCNLPQFSVPSEFAGVTSSHLTLLSSCNFSQCENCLERFHQKKL